jgi:hypothetical protein
MSALTSPDILYKYLPPERLDVLSNGLIRYTQFGAFNDPFDGHPHFTALSNNDDLMEKMAQILPEEIKRAYDSLPQDKQAQMPYELFYSLALWRAKEVAPAIMKNMVDITPLVQNCLRENLDKHIGALSLSEVADNVLMWSHYSCGHAGFALGFDTRHPYFNARLSEVDEFRHLRRVEYRNERPNAPMSSLSGVEMFLVKSTDWAYEKEWRIMRPLADSETFADAQPLPAHLFRYPIDAIKEIIFGAKMLPSIRSALLEVLAAQPALQHVVLKQASIDQQTYGVRITDWN